MRVLVTGGAGFIGSHVVDELVSAGHDVGVLDNLDAHRGRPDYLHSDVRYTWGDVRDVDAWRAAIGAGIDAVCHLAARVGLGKDFADVTAYVDDNDVGTAVGLAVLHERRFAGPLVVASSMVVYGEGAYSCSQHGRFRPGSRSAPDLACGRFDHRCPACDSPLAWAPIDERDVLDPRSVYAATKLHQEHLAFAYGREHGASVVALRYHNVYGPRMPRDTPYSGVAAIFRSAFEAGRSPKVFEDGRQLRDFVHVSDVARASALALTAADVDGPFNVASGDPHTVLEMANALGSAYGSGAPEPDVVGGARSGDVRHVVASPERARRVLGFRAQVGFADGMRQFATAPLRD